MDAGVGVGCLVTTTLFSNIVEKLLGGAKSGISDSGGCITGCGEITIG
jgi:hypothetical protein